MNSSEPYKWVKIVRGAGFVGIINLEVEAKSLKEQIEIIEDYGGTNYRVPQNWKEGIKKGLAFALSYVPSKWQVTIKNFEGSNVGTNSTIAGCAAMFALWDKIGFQPDKKLVDEVEQFVTATFFKTQDSVSEFENLRLGNLF